MIEIIDDINNFRLIKEECNNLADDFGMPLLQFEWLIHCVETFCPPAKLSVVIVRDKEEIKAIAPLVILKRYGIERLEFLGTSLHGEPGGFLYKDEDSLRELTEAVANLKMSVKLNGIRASSPEAAVLEQISRQKGITAIVTDEYIPWLPINSDWENFQKTISSSRRSSLKRLRRIAEKEGEVKFMVLCPDPELLNNSLEEIFRIESSGWKKRMGTAMLSNRKLGHFFKNYMQEAARIGILRLCYLSINDIKIAVQIGIEFSNRFWLLKIGYDEKWSGISPGILLTNEVIRYFFEKKLKAIEFLGSDESWLHIWTNNFHRLETYTLCNSPVSTFTNLAVGFTGSIINRLQTRIAKI